MTVHNIAKYPSPKNVFQTALTETANEDLEGLGTLRWDGENCYRWVKNQGSETFTEGHCVQHTSADYINSTGFINQMTTEDLNYMAGIVMASTLAASGAVGCFGWIQILGVNESVVIQQDSNSTMAVGSYLRPWDGEKHMRKGSNKGQAPMFPRSVLLIQEVGASGEADYQDAPFCGFIRCL